MGTSHQTGQSSSKYRRHTRPANLPRNTAAAPDRPIFLEIPPPLKSVGRIGRLPAEFSGEIERVEAVS
jgi:hypothetical protein